MRAAAALVVVLCTGGCDVGAVPFACAYDGQCVEGGVTGDCEPTGFCSFPDPGCDSGERYGEHAPEELSEQCVPKCIAEIALGKAHGCLRKDDGTVWCWGDDSYGQTGAGATAVGPHRVDGIVGARRLALGDYHSCAIAGDPPAVWCWGKNDSGQCGESTMMTSVAPTRVTLDEPPAVLAAGAAHSCASAGALSLYCWGANDEGQLGIVLSAPHAEPVTSNFRASVLAAGGGVTCAIDASDHASCWGGNGCGQLNSMEDPVLFTAPTETAEAVGVAMGESFGCVSIATRVTCNGWLKDGTCDVGQAQRDTPIEGTNANLGPQQISAGRSHACLLYRRGDVACWGAANAGQLGPTVTADSEALAIYQDGVPLAVQVAAGGDTSRALTLTGEVLCWGANGAGQLGAEPGPDEPHPVSWVSDAVSCP